MRVITEPSLPSVEDKLSIKTLSAGVYKKAIEEMYEQGYVPKGILLKRSVKPPFALGVPLKLQADWDPQLMDADMVIVLGERND